MLNLIDLIDVYYPVLDDEPFTSSKAQKDAWLNFVDLLASILHGELKNVLPTVYSRVGCRLDEVTPDNLVLPPGIRELDDVSLSNEMFELFEILFNKGFSKEKEPLFPLSRVLDQDLSNIEIFALVVAVAAASSRKYESVFSALSGEKDGEGVYPTVGLVSDLARYFLSEREDLSPLISPDSYLNRCVFKTETMLEKKENMAKTFMLSRTVKSFIDSGKPSLSALIPYATIADIIEDVSSEKICLKNTFNELNEVIVSSKVIELVGSEGSGRRYLLQMAASGINKRIITVDLNLLSGITQDGLFEECMGELIFLCTACDCIPYLLCHGDPEIYSSTLRETFFSLYEVIPTLCIGSEKPVPDEIVGGLSDAIFIINVPETTSHDQMLLWQVAAKEKGIDFPKDYKLNVLVSKYVMSPGRIFEVMTNVSAIMGDKKGKKKIIDEKILEEQIRRSCSVQFGENATRLASPFTWEDLMISPESEGLLRMAADRVRFRATVNEDYGFAKKLPYGRGVAIVFYGPPGTGKTMAAQVLANELGLDIYRIDLSQVSSKYIGETEKNLGVVFDAAKNSNAILFFDEADSLFSKRTEISSSNDKYANAETSYLLQKIEEYSGVSVLATNNMQNFDAAFKRRMTFLIPIEAPNEETRIRLWESVFPEDVPISPQVDMRILARVAELTGSSIKSAAVSASYLAAAAGRPVNWEDIIRAVDLEGTKTGTLSLGNVLREAILTGID